MQNLINQRFAKRARKHFLAKRKNHRVCDGFYGADYEARTRYLHLGKVALYQMS